jgi:uracil-DNA glycosylase family 4
MGYKREGISQLNEEIRQCTACRLCETRKNALCGEGNIDSKMLLIAQAPGKKEDVAGRMFIGPSGAKFDELLRYANIERKDIYITNLIKCMLPKNRKPKHDEIQICSQYLDREIDLINPDVIVPLGYYATRYMFEKYGISHESTDFFGKLYYTGEEKILPLRHPAALCYGNSLFEQMSRSYKKLAVLLFECKWYPACPMKRYYEKGVLDKKWIDLYCRGDWENCVRYHLEERGEPHPDWMLPDGHMDDYLKNI